MQNNTNLLSSIILHIYFLPFIWKCNKQSLANHSHIVPLATRWRHFPFIHIFFSCECFTVLRGTYSLQSYSGKKMKTFCTLSQAFQNLDKVSVGFFFWKLSADQTGMCCPEIAAPLKAVFLSKHIVADISVSPPDSASDAQTRRQGCHSDGRSQGNRIWGSPAHGQTGCACYHRYVFEGFHTQTGS